MATYTSHYNLKKPATSDKIRIADFNGNADTIDATMYDNATLGAQLKADIGIVENTNTATHNISAGQYVIWKGDLYTASSAISSGATLSSANLTAVSGGGLNALNSKITTAVKQLEVTASDSLATFANQYYNGYSFGLVLFTCAGNLATDMPSSANKYGNGFIDASGYYHSAWYYADDHKLYIGRKVFSATSWTWYSVQLSAV